MNQTNPTLVLHDNRTQTSDVLRDTDGSRCTQQQEVLLRVEAPLIFLTREMTSTFKSNAGKKNAKELLTDEVFRYNTEPASTYFPDNSLLSFFKAV